MTALRYRSCRMIQLCICAFVAVLPYSTLSAQTVQDPAFANKLSGLLDVAVPTVDVAHVTNSAVFLDAREPEEYNVSHIRGARLVGYKDLDLSVINDLPKDTAIVVYCSVGYRSQKVTEKLLDAGFTSVHNLYGGIFEWVNTERPVVDQKGNTQRVHTYNKTWSQWLRKGVSVY